MRITSGVFVNQGFCSPVRLAHHRCFHKSETHAAYLSFGITPLETQILLFTQVSFPANRVNNVELRLATSHSLQDSRDFSDIP